MPEPAWRKEWGYSSTVPRASRPASAEDSSLAPTSEKYSRWARMSEIRSVFERCDIKGRDTALKAGGFPVWSDGSVAYLDTSMNHVMIVAATNRHKTRGALMPTVAVSALERNVSYVIHDPKGELYRYLGSYLRSMGIDVRVVNFRNPDFGDCWNMLSIPYTLWKSGDVSRAKAMLTDIAALLSPIDSKTSNDLFWPSAGQYTLLGFMYALMVMAVSEEEANMSNLISIIRTASQDQDTFDNFVSMFDRNGDVATMLSTASNNSENTRRCIMGMVYNALAGLVCNDSLASMMSYNHIDLGSLGERPTALFLITPDEKNTYNPLVGQLVSQTYQELISRAQALGGTLPVRVNFVLDEFASLDRIEGIPDMLAAGRSRNIRCMLVIQSVAQLKSVYGDLADSIMTNCADWVYLGGRDTEFMDRLCSLSGNDKDGKPLLTTTQLMHLQKGREAFVLIDGMYPFVGRIADISDYDLGGLEFSEPELRADRRPPVIVGDDMFLRDFDEGDHEPEVSIKHFPDPPEDDDRAPGVLIPSMDDEEVGHLAWDLEVRGWQNSRFVIPQLQELSEIIDSPISVLELFETLSITDTPQEFLEVLDTLDLKEGVRRGQAMGLLRTIAAKL